MAFKFFDSKDAVPDDRRESAVETKDGKFVIDEPEDTSALEKTVRATRKERDEAIAAKRKAEEERDEKAKQLEAKEATVGQTDQKVADLLEKWKKDKDDAVKAAVEQAKKEMEPLTEKVTKYELDNALIQAFADAGGRSVKHQSMLRLAKNDWTLVDGKPVMRDAAGEISNVSLEDYFSKDFKTREPEYYEGTKAAGGGAAGVQKDGKRPETPATQPSKWTSDERRAFIEKNGQQAYRDLLNEQLREAVKPKEKAPA